MLVVASTGQKDSGDGSAADLWLSKWIYRSAGI
eukprot:COSAG06_NODE_24984_length_648_cov_0.754098_1_plen_32_part_10